MKHPFLWSLGASMTILAFVGARREVAAEPTPPATEETSLALAAEESAQEPAPPVDTDAPATLVSEEKPLPSNIKPSAPVAELIKLANSGLNESVMLAFVTNSAHVFNLTAEEIIYLNDIGVPGSVVTAMIQHDQQLKAGAPAPVATEPPPPPPATEPAPIAPTTSQFSVSTPPPQTEPMNADYAVDAPLTPPGEESDGMFYDSLAPYGNWVNVAGYGQCWQPTVVTVSPGWQPYYNCGHWVYSDCGWYWLSDYSWGWAPFHYGTWFCHSHLGWCWLPGRTWGPAWVSWRYSNHYCGWAPLPPGCSFATGVGLTFHGQRVGEHDDLGLRPGHYRFVAWDRFHDRELQNDRLAHRQVDQAYHESVASTRISGFNNTVINSGLPTSRVVAATGKPVRTVVLREAGEPTGAAGRVERYEGGGSTLAIYRPNPNAPTTSSASSPYRGQRSGSHTVSRPGSGQITPSAAPWSPHTGNPRQGSVDVKPEARPGITAPLVLRGPQTSGLRETAPPNSLVVIGRRNSAPSAPSAPSATLAESADSAASAASVPRADRAERATPAARAPSAATEAALSSSVANRPAAQNAQDSWMGTVSSSPQPAWFNGASRSTTAPGNASVPGNAGAPVYRPEARSFQLQQRSLQSVPRAAAEVPRYAPVQSYAPQRYSAPAASAAPARSPSFESRPMQSAPPARSAPQAAPAPAPSNSSASTVQGRR